MSEPTSGPIVIAAPPPVPRAAGTGTLTRLLIPAVTLLAGGGMVAAVIMSGASISHNPMFVLFPVMMLGSAIASAVQGGSRQCAAELDSDRRSYLNYLQSMAIRFADRAVAQREWLDQRHPAPEALWLLVGGPRMWQRRRGDPDFGAVRVGVGTVAAAAAPVEPGGEPDELKDPVTWTALRRFLRVYSTVSSAPVTVALTGTNAVTISGDSADTRALVRAMVCQLAVMHSPADLAVVAAVDDSSAGHWDWLKWLPHHRHRSAHDQIGALRMTYSTLAAALTAAPPDRCVVVIADGVAGTELPGGGVTVLEIGTGCADIAGRFDIRLDRGQVTVTVPGQGDIVARPDLMAPADAVICARRIAGYRSGHDGALGPASGWPELIGIPAIPVPEDWKALWDNVGDRRLQVPIGQTPSGAALELDIREAAEGGMGPHGLCVGATGSGKSELLRSIALGMIARHSPEALNLVLIDFKGGATFLGLDRANHVSAVITNLAEEAHLVDRMRDALTGEINRRQHILRSAGNLAAITDYDRARRAGRPLSPLPVLFVIVDEFSELLTQQPEFIDVFVAIGRLGRSLGIHLLLASQRLEEGRLRGLDAHLSYRICLKTLSESESRLSIGVPDAYELPGDPGAAYLKIAAAGPIRFQSAYVSGRITPRPIAPIGTAAVVPMVFTATPVGPTVRASDEFAPEVSVADTVLDSLTGIGPSAHQIWLPPLSESPTLDAVLAEPRTSGALMVPIGLVDNTFEQDRGPLVLNLAGSAGNVAVVGGPQSGKSTLLRTLVTALALEHDAGRIQAYCLDVGGGGLAPLTDLPQVGVVAGRHDVDLVRRTVAEIGAVLRRRQRGGPDRDDRFGDIFLVVDGWHAIRQDFDGLEQAITTIAAEGLSHNVHVVVAATRWADIRPALKDQIGSRIELRLGDPADSEIDRRRARSVPPGCPGRGLSPDGLPFVAALPIGPPDIGELIRARQGDRRAPAIRLLPNHIDHHDVLAGIAIPMTKALVVGIDENSLAAVTVDPEREPHLLILGDAQSGKTAALRVLCREILRTTTPAQAQLILVDPRRSMLGEIDADRLAGYLTTPAAIVTELPELLALLRQRLPDAAVTQHQLRTRSWWTGPDIHVVVDDYDLVATAGGNPLAPILDLLPHARDIGLHMVIARRHGGAARALYEPVLAAVRDLGATGLQLSGSPDEGPLLGTVRPRPLPPGRGTLSTRTGGEQTVQVAWTTPR